MAETYNYDNLFAGHVQPVVSGAETITGSAALTRGTCLGRITASGLLQLVDDAAVDGSETIYAILAEDADATGGDVPAVVYYTGEYNEDALVFGGDDVAADHKVRARELGMFFKTNIAG